MTPSTHPDPATRARSNQLLAEAGYEIAMGPSGESSREFRARLNRLRLQAFLLWPIAFFSTAILGWFFEHRFPPFSWLAFAGTLWVMFVGRVRPQRKLMAQRCPACGEKFFFAKDKIFFKQKNVWSNICANCKHHAG
jgi:hypothetical protein